MYVIKAMGMLYACNKSTITFGDLIENGFIGDPRVFFFFKVTTGGGVSVDGF